MIGNSTKEGTLQNMMFHEEMKGRADYKELFTPFMICIHDSAFRKEPVREQLARIYSFSICSSKYVKKQWPYVNSAMEI